MPTRRGKTIALVVGAVAVAVLAVAVLLSWPHLLFWWRFESLGKNAEGYPEYRHRQTGIVMVRVPGGKFWMGAQKTDPKGQNYDPEARVNEPPVHQVELSPFLIGKFEVSQAEWVQVMDSNPSDLKGDDLPVTDISWNDCQGFCRKTGLRLPTEAQWEFACRAGTTTPFAFGMTITPEEANYAIGAGSTAKTAAVTSFKPNGLGLHNMHGNVWEWCEDYCEDYWEFCSSTKACLKDPLRGPAAPDGGMRIRRGGGLEYDASVCRSAIRAGGNQEDSAYSCGFRAAFWPLP